MNLKGSFSTPLIYLFVFFYLTCEFLLLSDVSVKGTENTDL